MTNSNFTSNVSPTFIPSLVSNNKTHSSTRSTFFQGPWLLILSFLMVASALSGQTWNGSASADWDNGANWDGGLIPTASTDAIIPNVGTAPVILAGANAVAQSVWVQGGTSLTIEATGSLAIDGAGQFGLRNNGTLENSGSISIGAVTGGSTYGIWNQGTFNHNAGTISVNNTITAALRNNKTFNNMAQIDIGGLASVGTYGIQNLNSLINTAGTIHIDRSSTAAIYNGNDNDYGITNYAQIIIGANASVGQYGIWNDFARFQNLAGEIHIDQTSKYGVFNYSESFKNAALLVIGAVSSVGEIALYNQGVFVNAGGEISLDRSTKAGLLQGFSFTNSGNIQIGSIASVGNFGIDAENGFKNEAGTITIDRCTNAGVLNFGSGFQNWANIFIGSEASVGTSGIKNNLGIFRNHSGEVRINNCSNAGISNDDSRFYNDALINIGSLANIGMYGIKNRGIFENNAGEINIDRSSGTGILNLFSPVIDVTFTNLATINIGANAPLGLGGIENYSKFNNIAGDINIDNVGGDAVYNGLEGVFTNNAAIHIGALAPIGGIGIHVDDEGVFNNDGGGIYIDNTPYAGIDIYNATFTNAGELHIGSLANIGSVGISTALDAVFDNNGGAIYIDRSTFAGIYNASTFNSSGLIKIGSIGDIGDTGFTNEGNFSITAGEVYIDRFSGDGIKNRPGSTLISSGQIQIGSLAASGSIGIRNDAYFENAGGGIHIDNISSRGIENSKTFTSSGLIKIGSNAGTFYTGIENYKDFSLTGGELYIDRSTVQAISNSDVFSNDAQIYLGSIAACGYNGINNTSKFTNASGSITIDRTLNMGIYMELNANFTNQGQIKLGASMPIGQFGIFVDNNTVFNNDGGTVYIDNTTFSGITLDMASFTNAGELRMGSMSGIGSYGILLQRSSTFENIAGVFSIDRSSIAAVYNFLGQITNMAQMDIGGIASVGARGVWNKKTFNNNAGVINIDNTTSSGLFNAAGTFNNSAEINIGQYAAVGQYGVENNASFTNNSCAVIRNNAALFNNASINNQGLFSVNTTDAHSNTILNNNGIIEYPQGNPIPNVSNNDFVVAPISGECTDVYNALQKGGMLSFTAGTTWYQDAGLSIPAGTYDQTSNVFSNTNLPQGNHNLYFTIDDDDNGCQRTVSISVTMDDVTPPSITCPANTTLPADANCSNTLGTFAAASVTDNCSASPAVTQSPAASAIISGHNSVQTVTLSADDGNGNTGTCDFTVTLKDSTKPTISCPANTTLAANANCSSTLGTYAAATVADNCNANPAVTQSPISSTILSGHNTTQTVILTANDGNGNTETCDFTVTLKDNIKPTISCPANTTLAADASCSSNLGTFAAATVADNCNANPAVTQSPASSTVLSGHNSAQTVNLTANDGNGNSANCSFTVTLKDVTKPTVLCKNATVNLDAAGSANISTASVYQSGADNCGAVNQVSVTPNTFNCSNLGSNSVTLTVNDGNGNTNTCNATVTVVDAIKPSMLCKPATIFLDANGQATLLPAAVNNGSFDNCTLIGIGLSKSVFTCTDIGDNTVTLNGRDQSLNVGTCTATVTVVDAILPTALCKNQIVSLDAKGTVPGLANLINNGSSDNCSFALATTPSTLTCADIGVNTVILQATDASGNSATCTATVTVRDASGPTAKCKNPEIFLDASGHATLETAQVDNGSNDNCGIASMSLSQTEFNCSEVAGSPWAVTMTMRDNSNNTSSCLAFVTVRDNIAPTAVCENTSVQLSPNGIAIVFPANLAYNSSDNCSVWSYSPIAKVYTTANIGENDLLITVRDWSGNAATCVSIVTVLPANNNFNKPAVNYRAEEIPYKSLELSLRLYPNPTAGNTTLDFELPVAQDYRLTVFDMAGRIVMLRDGQGNEGANSLPIAMGNVAPGVYLLDLRSGDMKAVKRLIVQE